MDRTARVLLLKENYARRRWGLPGGAIEAGESPSEAAIREVEEETGLAVELEHLIAVYYLCTATRTGLRFIFAGRVIGGELMAPTDGIADVAWLPTDELPDHAPNNAPPEARLCRAVTSRRAKANPSAANSRSPREVRSTSRGN